jgi:hypothetical protein
MSPPVGRSRIRRALDALRRPRQHGRPAEDPDNLEREQGVEGNLDPNTALLMEGAPPAGTSGRDQPVGGSPDPRPPRGPSEAEVRNLPG